MPHFSPGERRALEMLARDVDRVFGPRLRSLVAYRGHYADGPVHSCAIVDTVRFADLTACLPLSDAWHRHGLAVPLLLTGDELPRTVDAFPLEYASIIADHALVRGDDAFAGLVIAATDIRRACEAQAKSHLIHLREGFVESHGEVRAIARLIAHSATPLRALLTSLARLMDGGPALDDAALARFAETRLGVPAGLVRDVFATAGNQASTIVDPSALLARYLEAAQHIWAHVDGWR
jgi:hypothetical protein